MRLSELALQRIKDSKSLPKKLRSILKVSQPTFWRYINSNSDELTKAAVLAEIRQATGLSDEQILEAEPVKA